MDKSLDFNSLSLSLNLFHGPSETALLIVITILVIFHLKERKWILFSGLEKNRRQDQMIIKFHIGYVIQTMKVLEYLLRYG